MKTAECDNPMRQKSTDITHSGHPQSLDRLGPAAASPALAAGGLVDVASAYGSSTRNAQTDMLDNQGQYSNTQFFGDMGNADKRYTPF